MKSMSIRKICRRELLAACTLIPSALKAASLSQVRIGVIADEIDEDLAKDIEFLQAFGVRYVELRSIWGKYNTSQPLDKIREARRLLDAANMRTSVVGTAFFRGALPRETPEGNEELQKQWALLNDAMDRAEILGANCLRTFAFMAPKNEKPKDSDYGRIHELLREAAKRAKARNIRLAVENLAGSYVAKGADSAKILKAVQDDALGLTWDPNNAAEVGEKPFPDGYNLLDSSRIYNVHLRDYRHLPDGKFEWTAVGDGEADNLGQIRALLKAQYKGVFTLETHYKSPQGKAFATKTSLTGLLKVVEKV